MTSFCSVRVIFGTPYGIFLRISSSRTASYASALSACIGPGLLNAWHLVCKTFGILHTTSVTFRIKRETRMKEPRKKKPINVEIGARIKQCRTACSLTQEQLSEHLDVTTQYISDLERGVTGASLSTIISLCRILETSADYMLMGKAPDPATRFTTSQQRKVLDILEGIDSLLSLPEDTKAP